MIKYKFNSFSFNIGLPNNDRISFSCNAQILCYEDSKHIGTVVCSLSKIRSAGFKFYVDEKKSVLWEINKTKEEQRIIVKKIKSGLLQLMLDKFDEKSGEVKMELQKLIGEQDENS